MQTLHEFVRKHKIKIRCKWTDRNPHMHESHGMDHWRCSLSRPGGKRMSVVFSMGSGHSGKEPTAEDVLNSLASDASGYLNANGFEDWASEYGYDHDSRSAHNTYKAVEREAKKLRKFLGDDLVKELMYKTEML